MFVWVLNTSLWNMENSTEFTHRFPESSNMQKQPSLGVLRKICFLKICSKFTGEHPCWSVISNLLNIFRAPFPKKTSGWLILNVFNHKGSFRTKCFSSQFIVLSKKKYMNLRKMWLRTFWIFFFGGGRGGRGGIANFPYVETRNESWHRQDP